MGLLSFVRNRDPPGYTGESRSPDVHSRTVEYNDHLYDCAVTESVDHQWEIAYGRRQDGTVSRVFRISAQTIVDTTIATHPTAAAIATDGSAIYIERLDSANTSQITLLQSDGHVAHRTTVETPLRTPVISADGARAAVISYPPNVTVTLFSLNSLTNTVTYVLNGRRGRLLGFYEDTTSLLYVTTRPNDEPYLALNPQGEIIWGNARYRNSQPITERFRGWVRSVAGS